MHAIGQMLTQRWEVKYLVNRTTRVALDRDLRALMPRDPFANGDGTYRVRSLYFDTPDYMAYHSKMAGEAVRHKIRARLYGDDPALARGVRLEVKSRYNNTVHKIADDVSRDDYGEIWTALQKRCLPPPRILDAHPKLREFFRLQKMYNMEPKIIVQYRRHAYERLELSRVRVNFDDRILISRDTDLFGDLRTARRIMRYGHSVFEIKVDGGMPFWLHTLIGKYDLMNEAVSKFCYGVLSEARTSAAVVRGD